MLAVAHTVGFAAAAPTVAQVHADAVQWLRDLRAMPNQNAIVVADTTLTDVQRSLLRLADLPVAADLDGKPVNVAAAARVGFYLGTFERVKRVLGLPLDTPLTPAKRVNAAIPLVQGYVDALAAQLPRASRRAWGPILGTAIGILGTVAFGVHQRASL